MFIIVAVRSFDDLGRYRLLQPGPDSQQPAGDSPDRKHHNADPYRSGHDAIVHPSKVDLVRSAHEADYSVALHVVLIPEELAVERVQRRVRHGGHDVPEDKIRERHRRLWDLVANAIEMADTATIYDNSRRTGPRIVAQFTGGTVVGAPRWPTWATETLTRRWPV